MKKSRIIIASFAAAFVFIAVMMRVHVFDLIIIRGNSMFPVLMQNDRVLLNKLAYRNKGPERGDIISLKIKYRRIVKRVIGIPGDVVEFRDGLIYCDGKFAGEDSYSHNKNPHYQKTFRVSSRHVFVIGDNVEMSWDSRNYGTVPYQDIIGKATFIYFPPKRIGKIMPGLTAARDYSPL